MAPRIQWACLAILFGVFSDDGILAFSPSSLSSRPTPSFQATPAQAGKTRPTTIGTIGNPSHNYKRRSSSPSSPTSLQASPTNLIPSAFAAASSCFAPPIANLALQLSALTATLAGGAFAGSLHAIAGPDHLAALIPRCCGLPWYRAASVGAVWGLGHGVSATLVGMSFFFAKRGIRLLPGVAGGFQRFGDVMELAIGGSLVVIGLLGIKEAREWEAPPTEAPPGPGAGVPQSLSAAVAPPYRTADLAVNPRPAKSAVAFNGFLHGFSWDGAPSLAPAVAFATWRGSLAFLLSYALGTVAAMTVATTIIGEGTRRAAGKLDRPDLPRDLSVGSSFLALVVGVVWCGLALR